MVERPKIGVGVFVVRDGKILVGLRQGGHGAGAWALPGGHLEFGEEIEDCATREVMEETGMRISHHRHVDFINSYDGPSGTHYVTVFIIADWVEGEAQLCEPEKCSEWRWITWPNVPVPVFHPLRNYLATGQSPFPS